MIKVSAKKKPKQKKQKILFFKSGYVCKRNQLKANGCCNEELVDQSQFSCMYCNKTAECCVEYEYCISCCLHPDNVIIFFLYSIYCFSFLIFFFKIEIID